MFSILLTFIAGALILLIFYLLVRFTYWKRNGIPTARGCYPFFGHMLPVLTLNTSMSDVVRKVYDDYQNCSMVGIYKVTQPALIIRDPNLIRSVLISNVSSFHKNAMESNPNVDSLINNHPFFNDGEVWLTGRKHLTYAFSGSRLRNLFIAISGVCKKFQRFIDRQLEKDNKYDVEFKYLFTKFTGEVVANAGLGIEGRCFEDEDHPTAFDQIGRAVFKTSLFDRFVILVLTLFPKLNRLMKIDVVPKDVDQLFRGIVDEYLSMKEKESTPRFDFLHLMMELEKTGEKVDKNALASHAFTFYADGLETSSITLSYVGYQLAVHQDVQKKLRDEVKSMIEKHGELTYDALAEMKYMEQVINESQRCYPAADMLQKSCTKECVLEGPDGLSCRVKPDTHIILPLGSLQSDSKYWPDPQTFDPERFNPERKQTIEKMAFLPFGDGPRMCVGMRLAMLQMKACLATLVNNYKLELSPKTKLPFKTITVFELILPVGLRVQISKL
ncbi:cytochrome P450 6a2-like [Ceratina calcarata]|uniref:Cytochrome P450 6a2-like n=1 Tax=Ceratina calcarata TaxID=156304 RepID=A0AAJ7J543_9HYME|nr:cytochrome P450 6a2-like [Ceratina calcarata]